ncbi:MAG: hypothetical protein WHT82_05880 [Limisphaera sp.]
MSKGPYWKLTAFYTNEQRVSIEAGDGSNVFSLRLGPVRFSPSTNRVAIGIVRRVPWPDVALPPVPVIWMAHCAGNLLRQNFGFKEAWGTWPAPWTDLSDPMARIYRVRYQPLLGGDGSPLRLEFHADPEAVQRILQGQWDEQSAHGARLESLRDYLARRSGLWLDGEKVHAVYEVLRTVRCGPWEVPAVWRLRTFDLLRSGPSGEPLEAMSYRGEIEWAEPIAEMDYLPRWPGYTKEVQVSDYRLADPARRVAFVGYKMKNWAWRTDERDPYLRELQARQATWAQRNAAVRKLPREVAAVIFGVALVSPLLFRGVRTWLRELVRSWMRPEPGA